MQARPLQPVYAVVFMDAMMVKMRYDGVIKNVAIYSILGIDLDGMKSCLGLYVGKPSQPSTGLQ